MTLDEATESRQNNFNLLRLLAAMLVLCSHSVSVVTGDADLEPLRRSLGMTLGSLAVDIFFVISGLLITRSLSRSRSWFDFVLARALRLLPGLVVSLVVTVGIAAMVYHRTIDFGDAVAYVMTNSVPVGHLQPAIKGVFEGNPAGPGFNGSLWTLPVEVRMYRNLFLLWLGSLLFFRFKGEAFRWLVLAFAAYTAWVHFTGGGMHGSIEAAPFRLPMMFFAGASAFVLARRIRMTWATWVCALAVLAVSSVHAQAFYVCYSALLWYLVLGVALLPQGRVLEFNKVGDYSYGVYIYAWPVQQMVIAAWPGIGILGHTLISATVVLALAALSWHAVESHALALKGRVRGRLPLLARS